MHEASRWLWVQIELRMRALRDSRDDIGASVVETVIIAAGLAALALGVIAAVKILVDAKVAGIKL